jgi:hypothetical protein
MKRKRVSGSSQSKVTNVRHIVVSPEKYKVNQNYQIIDLPDECISYILQYSSFDEIYAFCLLRTYYHDYIWEGYIFNVSEILSNSEHPVRKYQCLELMYRLIYANSNKSNLLFEKLFDIDNIVDKSYYKPNATQYTNNFVYNFELYTHNNMFPLSNKGMKYKRGRIPDHKKLYVIMNSDILIDEHKIIYYDLTVSNRRLTKNQETFHIYKKGYSTHSFGRAINNALKFTSGCITSRCDFLMKAISSSNMSLIHILTSFNEYLAFGIRHKKFIHMYYYLPYFIKNKVLTDIVKLKEKIGYKDFIIDSSSFDIQESSLDIFLNELEKDKNNTLNCELYIDDESYDFYNNEIKEHDNDLLTVLYQIDSIY